MGPRVGRPGWNEGHRYPRLSCALPIVWKVYRSAVPVVRFWLELKLHGGDRGATFKQCPGDPVHSVHDPAIDAKDDWVQGVDLLNEAHVLDHLPNGRHLHASVEPVVRIHVMKGIERDFSDREFRTETDQFVDVPSIQALVARPEVVLLTHGTQSAAPELSDGRRQVSRRPSPARTAQSRWDTRPTLDLRVCASWSNSGRCVRSRSGTAPSIWSAYSGGPSACGTALPGIHRRDIDLSRSCR